MNTTLDPQFADALRRDLIAHVTTPARRRRRKVAFGGAAALVAAAAAFGVSGVATGRDVADPPLAPPMIVNGVGPATVRLPAKPAGATYLRVELVCFASTRCVTPNGSAEAGQAGTQWQRDVLPVTDAFDPTLPQLLDPIDPADGMTIDTDKGAHWRLYAVYTDRLRPRQVILGPGRILGIPGGELFPTLVPVVADNGRAGYVDPTTLMDNLVLGPSEPLVTMPTTDPLPVYDDDGTTVIGQVTVDTPYQPQG